MSDFWAHVAGRGRESQGQVRPRTAALFEPFGGLPPVLPAGMVEAERPTAGAGRPTGQPGHSPGGPFTGDESPVAPTQPAGQTGGGPGPAEDRRPGTGDRPPRTPSGEERPGLRPPFRLDTVRATAAPPRLTIPKGESGAGLQEGGEPVADRRAPSAERGVPAADREFPDTDLGPPTADRRPQTADRPPAVRPAIIRPESVEPPAEKAVAVHPAQSPAGKATGAAARPAAIEPAVHPAIEDRLVATGGPPIIRVRIGRIEVKAALPDRPATRLARPEQPYQPPLSLDDYLRQRSGGNA